MRGSLRRLAAFSFVFFLSASCLLAHHSASATYDTSKPIKLKGIVTKLDWKNPHVYYYIDVTGANGAVVNWAIESSTPNTLYRAGWRKTDLKIGDAITIEGTSPARNGSSKAYGGTVFLPDGRKVFSGSAATDR
jgi:hypothetical protein